MRVLLIDADSVIPNIPLMKLSAFHKASGDDVTLVKLSLPYYPNRKEKRPFVVPRYDRTYCSVVFEGNKDFIHGENVVFGGTGHDLRTSLPEWVEEMDPDYSIYPENETSYGFITRGCVRNCWFCKVPEKEGGIRKVSEIRDIVRHKKVKFLDNNILAYSGHMEVLRELADLGIKCQFNQGLDIRLLDERNSDLLFRLNYLGDYLFAFDSWSFAPQLERKEHLLRPARDWRVKFFVYVHPSMAPADITNRIRWLRERRFLAYVMRDLSCWGSENEKFFTDLASYCNQPRLFRSMTFETFLAKKHRDKARIEKGLVLWKE